eukprot:gnl/TRDRNA2_/TRDRNA2_164838_c0_seq1.p1 gnl/TRDRNA2_/TRDRNA2_164838_c0~~gnl/TRDRNA2_/TRDRNA2_164838_c0_seq1.p1  ORF type:complete len:437 (-),score=41.76 gnl/TRDRNA2_/TRDRNA2_164838_c0_seq1:42-1241(-)
MVHAILDHLTWTFPPDRSWNHAKNSTLDSVHYWGSWISVERGWIDFARSFRWFFVQMLWTNVVVFGYGTTEGMIHAHAKIGTRDFCLFGIFIVFRHVQSVFVIVSWVLSGGHVYEDPPQFAYLITARHTLADCLVLKCVLVMGSICMRMLRLPLHPSFAEAKDILLQFVLAVAAGFETCRRYGNYPIAEIFALGAGGFKLFICVLGYFLGGPSLHMMYHKLPKAQGLRVIMQLSFVALTFALTPWTPNDHQICQAPGRGLHWRRCMTSECAECGDLTVFLFQVVAQVVQLFCFLLACGLLPSATIPTGIHVLTAYIFHLPFVPLVWNHGVSVFGFPLVPSLASSIRIVEPLSHGLVVIVMYAYAASLFLASEPAGRVLSTTIAGASKLKLAASIAVRSR